MQADEKNTIEHADIVVTDLGNGRSQYDIRPYDETKSSLSFVQDADHNVQIIGLMDQGQRVSDRGQRFVDLINNMSLSVKSNGDGSFALDTSDLSSEINVTMLTDLKKSFSMAKDAIAIGAGEPEVTAGKGDVKVKVQWAPDMINRCDM